MLQIVFLLGGAISFIMGLNGFIKGEIKLTDKPLKGTAAKICSAFAVTFGLVLLFIGLFAVSWFVDTFIGR